jgi:zinc transport system ATP-binding protein
MGAALEVSGLSVELGGAAVLRDLSLRVEQGSAVAVIGPNGSGKTVLFKTLIGVLPHRGTIRWAEGTKLGYVPQKLDMERDLPLTGEDFLRAKAAVVRAAAGGIDAALRLVALGPEQLAKPIGALSGGQFQRLLLAFALVGDPNVLLLDEPLAGIDEPGQEKLNDTIHRLQSERGMTVLLISHDLSVVFRYATSVLCLGAGPVCFGAPRDVLTPEVLRSTYGSTMRFHVHDHDHDHDHGAGGREP